VLQDFLPVRQGDILVPVALDALVKVFDSDARDRFLPGGVDVQENEDVGLVESGAELLQEVPGAVYRCG